MSDLSVKRRDDLLAMSDEDIIALSNRGTFKRIQKELERPELTVEISADDEALVFRWSDDVTCTIAHDESLSGGSCTCESSADLCRHLLRSVLAYQRDRPVDEEAGDENGAISQDPGPWDPGAWDETALKACFPIGEQRRAKRLISRGLVIELVRGRRPTARFHKLGHLVRFLVHGDPAAALCDCNEPNPCIHTLLAIWGFREMEEGEDVRVLSLGKTDEPLPRELVSSAKKTLAGFVLHGVSGMDPLFLNRLRALKQELGRAGAIWLESIVVELVEHLEDYESRNARFSAGEVAALVGEFLLRLEAAEHRSPALPRYFLTGHRRAGKSSFGRTSLVGLGSTARVRGTGAELLAIAQDTATGNVVAVSRHFEPDLDGRLAGFDQLGTRTYAKTPGIATFAGSKLIIERAGLHFDHRLKVSNTNVGVYPQDFDWESLAPPLFLSDFKELRARLRALPPSALRPRRLGESFVVCAVQKAREVCFCARTQTVRALLEDSASEQIELVHPYLRLNAGGTESLLYHLADQSSKPCFVSGFIRPSATGIAIEPAAVILSREGARYMVQPWLDPLPEEDDPEREGPATSSRELTLEHVLRAHQEALAESVLLGREQARLRLVPDLERLLRQCQAVGLQTIALATARLLESLDFGATRNDFVAALFFNLRLARLATAS